MRFKPDRINASLTPHAGDQFMAMTNECEVERFPVGRVRLSRVNLYQTTSILQSSVAAGRSGYVCITNVRTAHLANQDAEYCRIQNESLLSTPDGMPLVWYAHRRGLVDVGRVSGPDLMDAILHRSGTTGHSHYFYGSTPAVAQAMEEQLRRRYADLTVFRVASPPMQPLESFDVEGLSREINRLSPTFFWVGLGAPKQERLMALLQPKLRSTVSIGVGLAFEYLAGTVKRAPEWMQKSGLEWVYRLSQQPAKLARFARPFCWYLAFVAKEEMRRGGR